MRRTSFSQWPCSIARTMDFLGDWWTPLVLREVFFGSTRFDDIQRALSIGRNVLAARLRRLTAEGVLRRDRYQDHPPRYEYRLTEKGRDFYPVLLAVTRWGDRWLHGSKGPPILLRHTGCGQITRGEVVCERCRKPLPHAEVMAELPNGRKPDLDVRIAATYGAPRAGAPRKRPRTRNLAR
ncbi:MAG TPA: helix-turn-helix domain-containing protein [Candidatus Binatia bacterium]|jgi:DNA-binding HxlR family transcriptional regulator